MSISLAEIWLKIVEKWLYYQDIIKKGFLVFLIFWNILWFLILLQGGIFWLNDHNKINNRLSSFASLPNWQNNRFIATPKPLQILDIKILTNSKGNFDLVAHIYNPNKFWALKKFSYYFQINSSQTKKESSFILPNQSKHLIYFDWEEEIPPSQKPQIVFSDLEWQEIKFPEKLPKVDFQIQNIQLKSVFDPQTNQSFTRFQGEIFNYSIYNFCEVDLKLLLKAQDKLLAVGFLSLENLASLEKRPLSFIWRRLFPGAQIEIEPEVNILDPEVFKKF